MEIPFAFAGERFPADRLHQAGLVSRLIGAGQAVVGAREPAARIAPGVPPALAAGKRVIGEPADWHGGEAPARQGEAQGPVFGSADATDGEVASAKKRAPAWRGT